MYYFVVTIELLYHSLLCQLLYILPLFIYMVYGHVLNLVALGEVFLQILHSICPCKYHYFIQLPTEFISIT